MMSPIILDSKPDAAKNQEAYMLRWHHEYFCFVTCTLSKIRESLVIHFNLSNLVLDSFFLRKWKILWPLHKVHSLHLLQNSAINAVETMGNKQR